MDHAVNPAFPAQWTVFGARSGLQQPFDAAVVMPTTGRPQILKAVQSVYAQRNVSRVQLLIGLDKPSAPLDALLALLAAAPPHITPCLFYPGYSSSVRHGGLHPAKDGGVLRSTLTYLANAACVAYLDDDNWWADTHLSELRAALRGHDWAYALRWFVHPRSLNPVCVDEWESVGPGQGLFRERFGGFVDPNCLMINKLACWQCTPLWNLPLRGDEKGMSADRNVFNCLRNHGTPGQTGKPSVYYVLDPQDGLHELRMQHMGPKYAAAG